MGAVVDEVVGVVAGVVVGWKKSVRTARGERDGTGESVESGEIGESVEKNYSTKSCLAPPCTMSKEAAILGDRALGHRTELSKRSVEEKQIGRRTIEFDAVAATLLSYPGVGLEAS